MRIPFARKTVILSAGLALAGCGTMNGNTDLQNLEPKPAHMGGAALGAVVGTVVSGGLLAPALGAVAGAVIAEEATADDGVLRDERNQLLGEDEQAQPESVAAGGTSDSAGQAAGGASASERDYPARAVTPEMVRSVQQRLDQEGFSPGPIDGIWGPHTADAVREFQQADPELEATGQLSLQTLEALGISTQEQGRGAAGGTAAGSDGSSRSSGSAGGSS